MTFISILLTLSALVALSAGIPQMVKLIKGKNSDEFNLGTWTMWAGTQAVSAAYAVSIGDLLLILISAAWVSFYIAMSVLIIRYSSSRHTLFKSVQPYDTNKDVPIPVTVTPNSPSPLELTTEPLK